MRAISVNLYNGRADPAALGGLIETMRPDLLVAQEVGMNAVAVLRKHFDHGVVVGADDCSGRAMLARFPVEVRAIDLVPRPALSARVAVGGAGVTMFGVHLSNPVEGPAAIGERGRQVQRLVEETAGLDRVVVMGDCNATPWWPTYRNLRRTLDDGVLAWAKRADRTTRRTWSLRPGWPALLRIDHVFTRGVAIASVAVAEVDGSDHRALVVDLEIV